MRKQAVLVLALFLCLISISVLSADEVILIDNQDIQQYKSHTGVWEKFTSYSSLKHKVRIYGTSLSTVRKINTDFDEKRINGFYFIPYSESYIQSLHEKGIKRQKISLPEGDFLWPVNDDVKITSNLGPRWGKFHAGLDISAPRGTVIVASMEGRVIKSEYVGGYGNAVIIECRDQILVKYGHNSVNLVKEGDFVKKGQIIALLGSSGRSTGPHCHLEIRIKNIPLEPLDFLVDRDVKILHKMSENWKRK